MVSPKCQKVRVAFSTWSDFSRKMLLCCLWLRSTIRAHNKPDETQRFLNQNSSWACFSTPSSLPCINPQALSCTKSWNWRMSRPTCVWTKQGFLSSSTGKDLRLPFAVDVFKSFNRFLSLILTLGLSLILTLGLSFSRFHRQLVSHFKKCHKEV